MQNSIRPILVLAASLTASLPAIAVQAATPQQCTRRWDEMKKTNAAGAFSYQTFMVSCLGEQNAAQTAVLDRPDTAPSGATARCRDGTYSNANASGGVCTQHRGVMGWLK
jgi:creatinine amidohydrolase/Fe(II)-dependent formamide hydrolase-like protein